MFKYQTPPKPIADIVDAPRMPGFAISPDGRQFALMALPGLPGIEEVAGPELRLAGLRIDPRTNGPSRITHYRGITLVDIATRRERDVESLPADLRLGTVSFSPDGKHIVCTHTTAQGIELWKIDVDGAIASRLADVHVNDTYGPRHPAVAWLSDSEHVLCRIVPRERGAPPVPSTVPVGPVVDESAGVRAAARTYQDLLHDPDDEALFEHYATSMLVKISLEGAVHEIVGPGLLRAASPSPNARFVLIDRLERPFSYLVPHDRFATRVELWTVNGERVRELAALPLAENVPIGMEAVRTGPRRFGWRPDRDNELNWVEALDGGDPRATAERRDRIYRSDATEESEHTIMAELALRFRAMQWSESGFALVSERWWGDRRERVSLVDPDDPTSDPRVLWDRSFEDRYNDPGRPLTIPNARGCPVLAMDRTGAYLFLVGEGASPDGDRPFLDRFALASGGSERLWRSSPPRYETCVRLLSPDTGEFMTTV
ncbi:MAG: S9 family peptidase, partial [Gammaproteobacteria bacterium]